MEMTNGEIVSSYKQAKHKARQIGILAELNRCSNKQIIEILLNGGIPLKSFNRFKDVVPAETPCIDTSKEQELVAVPEDTEEPVQSEEQLPSGDADSDKGIYELFVPLYNKVAALREERERIDNELGALNMYLNRLEDEIAGRSNANE